jgi:hypothetical protein
MVCRVSCTVILASSCVLAQTATSPIPKWARVPADRATQVEVDPAIRQVRSEAFNDRSGIRQRLDEPKPSKRMIGYGSSATPGEREPLLVGDSDAIAVGTVTGYQSFFSADRTAIYTELYLTVEKVLKTSLSEVTQGAVLTILRTGGALRHDGAILTFPPTGTGSEELDLNGRYVLILKSNPELKVYRDDEGWRLENNRAIPLLLSRRPLDQRDPRLIRLKQLTEGEFLAEVSAEVERSKPTR